MMNDGAEMVTVAEMTADEARAHVEWWRSAPRPWFDDAGNRRLWKAYDIIRIEREAHEAAMRARPKTYTQIRFEEYCAKRRRQPAPAI